MREQMHLVAALVLQVARGPGAAEPGGRGPSSPLMRGGPPSIEWWFQTRLPGAEGADRRRAVEQADAYTDLTNRGSHLQPSKISADLGDLESRASPRSPWPAVGLAERVKPARDLPCGHQRSDKDADKRGRVTATFLPPGRESPVGVPPRPSAAGGPSRPDHPSCEAGRSEPARGRLAPGWRLGTEDGAALWATLVPHDDRRVIEAKHGREEEVWWTRSDASC